MIEVDSFGALASILQRVAEEKSLLNFAMMSAAADSLKARAQAKLGEYQDSTGPFAAWASLADTTKSDRVRQGYPEDEPGLRSGEMRDSVETFASAFEAGIGSNDDKWLWFEFGTDKQPPRSVMGASLFELAPRLVESIGHCSMLAVAGMTFSDIVIIAKEQIRGQNGRL